MTSLPQTTYFWRVVGADDASWSEAAGGSFTPAADATVEVVSVGASRPRAILAAATPAVVEVIAPAIIGALPNLSLGPDAVDVAQTAAAFSGDDLVYALLDAPGWAVIDAATGEIGYAAPSAAGSAGTWRVRASNVAGAAELSFAVDVLAAAVDTALAFLPQQFSNGTLPVALSYDAAQPIGARWTSDYDKTDWIGAGARHYVDAAAGSDANAGTPALPWLTLAHALTTAASGDVIELAAGRYRPAAIPAWKDVSIIAASGARVVIGDLLTEAAITWGAPSAGYQTATLASGTIAGFTDLTQLRAGYPSVARQVADIAAGDVRKAQGYPAHAAGSNLLGAVDGRDLSGSADTDLLIWSAAATTPLTINVGANVYLEGVTLAGNQIGAYGNRLVMEGVEFLGSRGQLISTGGDLIVSNSCMRGAAIGDVMDYTAAANFAELNSLIDHSGEGANDNCSTAHEYACGVRLGCTYEGKRPLHDIGEQPILIVDCTSTAWEEFGDVALRTGAPLWIQGLTLTSSTGAEQIAAEGETHIVDEAIGAYAATTNVNATLDAVSGGSDYADPVIAVADPSALAPLAFYDGNDPASRIVSGSSVTAWNDLGASVDLSADIAGRAVTEATPGGRGAVYLPNVSMAGTGVAAAINAAQAFTLHAFVDVEQLNGKGLITLGTNANGLDVYLNASGGATVKLKVGGATVLQLSIGITARRLAHFAVVCDGTQMTAYADRNRSSGAFSTTLAFADGIQVNRRGDGTSANRGTATYAEIALFAAAQDPATVATFRQRGIDLFGTRL